MGKVKWFLVVLVCLVFGTKLPEEIPTTGNPTKFLEMDEMEWHERAAGNKDRRFRKK
jgi:hypothetical protein